MRLEGLRGIATITMLVLAGGFLARLVYLHELPGWRVRWRRRHTGRIEFPPWWWGRGHWRI